jgi:hypothetical protein
MEEKNSILDVVKLIAHRYSIEYNTEIPSKVVTIDNYIKWFSLRIDNKNFLSITDVDDFNFLNTITQMKLLVKLGASKESYFDNLQKYHNTHNRIKLPLNKNKVNNKELKSVKDKANQISVRYNIELPNHINDVQYYNKWIQLRNDNKNYISKTDHMDIGFLTDKTRNKLFAALSVQNNNYNKLFEKIKNASITLPKKLKASPLKTATVKEPVRVAPVRVAPVRVAPVRVAPVRVEPVRVEPVRVAPVRVAPVKAPPLKAPPLKAPVNPAEVEDLKTKSIKIAKKYDVQLPDIFNSEHAYNMWIKLREDNKQYLSKTDENDLRFLNTNTLDKLMNLIRKEYPIVNYDNLFFYLSTRSKIIRLPKYVDIINDLNFLDSLNLNQLIDYSEKYKIPYNNQEDALIWLKQSIKDKRELPIKNSNDAATTHEILESLNSRGLDRYIIENKLTIAKGTDKERRINIEKLFNVNLCGLPYKNATKELFRSKCPENKECSIGDNFTGTCIMSNKSDNNDKMKKIKYDGVYIYGFKKTLQELKDKYSIKHKIENTVQLMVEEKEEKEEKKEEEEEINVNTLPNFISERGFTENSDEVAEQFSGPIEEAIRMASEFQRQNIPVSGDQAMEAAMKCF